MTTVELTYWFMRRRRIGFLDAQKLAEAVVIRRREKDAERDAGIRQARKEIFPQNQTQKVIP